MRNNSLRAMLTIVPVATFINAAPVANAESPPRARYTDGVYTARGQYGGQPSFVIVTVTLKDGVIAEVSVQPQAYVPRSLELQKAFAAAVPQVVVGKPIDQVKVGKLAGSSGTPKGFNDAIRQIRDQARSR
jgi:uncharacterized protein with FMN-binding domain